jgi:hypothetical protein
LDAADVRGLLGLLLADGSLAPYRAPGGGYVQLTLTAGPSESAFLEDKVADFRHFLPTKAQIVPYNTTPRSNGKTTPVLRFRVSTSKLFPIYNLLYPRGERRITSTVIDMLGAQAAAWLWAEGARPQAGGTTELARVGLSTQEALLVQQWLEMLTGAVSQVDLERVRPRLWFDAEQSRKLKDALSSYAPRSRQHLFNSNQWDVSSIRGHRTQLLYVERQDSAPGQEATPLDDAAAL